MRASASFHDHTIRGICKKRDELTSLHNFAMYCAAGRVYEVHLEDFLREVNGNELGFRFDSPLGEFGSKTTSKMAVLLLLGAMVTLRFRSTSPS